MKKIFLMFMLTAAMIHAQERSISNYVLGINYLKSEIIDADLNMYNIHFEKQSTGNLTFGGEIFFKSGTTISGEQNIYKEVKSLYFAGPSLLYTDVIFGMLHYKASLSLNLGYIHYEDIDYDMQYIDKSIYYGFSGKIEGLAIVSTRMQFVLGLGFMKGYPQSGGFDLDTSPFYHIGLTYMF